MAQQTMKYTLAIRDVPDIRFRIRI